MEIIEVRGGRTLSGSITPPAAISGSRAVQRNSSCIPVTG